ncbi:AI-2E family transporter [Listeria monocytogenes CFSAN003807]|nr:AI-2E family transporter [Listeria monocytogenes]EAG6255819.1 AI-2E family transporter [Listeria monocytogenes CFSAN003807]EAE4776632.1 AI-2E family transporter [Listeria monocytogenes]EIO1315577.1 AI-2E family transporter [Listeria monocytogenes]HAB0807568.1 AI-2E family transporter [Listeria monocytogenes]
MNWLEKLKENDTARRVLVFVLLGVVLYLLRSMIDLILLTFIFAFLVTRLENVILKRVRVPRKLIVIVLYSLVAVFLYVVIVHFLPILINQISQLVDSLVKLYNNPSDNTIVKWIVGFLKESNIQKYLQAGVDFIIASLSGIGSVGLSFFLALILSLFFSLEKERVTSFTGQFMTSKAGFIFKEAAFFGKKFVSTFGVVLEAQLMIALVNTFITTIALYLMDFPQLLSLSIMVFVLGLIPVAGVIISCIPLVLIAYSVGGFQDVVYILITVVIVHAIETYILNPKLMSSKTNLPVFYTFIILIFSETFFGVWGLIVGIPVFVFLLDILEVRNAEDLKKRTIFGRKKKVD